MKLIEKYTAEQTALQERTVALTQGLEQAAQAKTDVDEFIRRLKLYFNAPTLTREMCLALFDRLVIGGKETVTGKPQEIHIYYKIDIDSVLSVWQPHPWKQALCPFGLLEGYAEYYSAELSQKIQRGNNESRRKGNLTGGKIPYGYKNVDKKAGIIPEEADIVRYIYERYSIGVYVKDIISELNEKGLLHKGKPFVPNTVYSMLGNERYSGIYRHNGDVFDNIYPQIVPQETFDKVRAKVNANKFGKRSEHITYLLKDKIKCGYCGKSIIGDNGTAHNGERKYYYTCQGHKKKTTNCHKQSIRKDILEKIVLDSITEQIQKNNSLDFIVKGLMREQ